MEEAKNVKKLGLIFISVILIVLFIIIIAFVATMPIGRPEQLITTTRVLTTTRAFDYGFEEIELYEQKKYNELFNDERIKLAFANAIYRNRNLRAVNLIESEIAKFKFIFSYANFANMYPEPMSINEINEYANKFFNTNLMPRNLQEFIYEEGFKFDIKRNKIDYCYQVTRQQGRVLLINLVHKSDEGCEQVVLDNDLDSIINVISIRYNIINGNYVFQTYTIIR